MFGPDEFTALDLRENTINIARIKVIQRKIHLLKLDKHTLAEPIDASDTPEQRRQQEDTFDDETDDIFGLEESEDQANEENTSQDLNLEGEDELEEIDFEDLELESDQGEQADDMALDMVEETDSSQSNEMVVYNILSEIDSDKVNLGVNIPAGNTIFQIIRDTNFKEAKKKDIIQDIEDRLKSIYGMVKSDDYYTYVVREDGSLLLASIEEESPMLSLVNDTREVFPGKIMVKEVLPDEAALVGMINANYDFPEDEVTGLLQFGKRKCRVVFLKGNEIWQVSPIINEGTKDKSFLNTIFSKILFQLDTGEVPNLNRIIIANNTLGEEAVEFFKKNFSDITVTNFRFNEEKFDFENIEPETARSFTTAIAHAWAASGLDNEHFKPHSMLPDYVVERQKIFKLQWHGVILLLLIFLAPLTFNHFYQENMREIEELSSDLSRINNQIEQVDPTVQNYNEVSEELGQIREQLVLIDTLSDGSHKWSRKFEMLNEGIQDVGNTWITSMTESDDGTRIEGYTMYRNRIPRVVNLFDDATLQDVTIEEVRENEVFQFSIMARKFDASEGAYSPPTPDDLQEILNN